MTPAFQIGDVVRNRHSKDHGRIVRIYTDLLRSEDSKPEIAYVVGLPSKEALWREAEIEAYLARAEAGSFYGEEPYIVD